MCYVFSDAFLYTTVVICGYLTYCYLSVSLNQSGHSPMTTHINKLFLPTELLLTGCFCFSHHFSVNSRDCCMLKSQNISSLDTETNLFGTKNHSQSYLDHISSSL